MALRRMPAQLFEYLIGGTNDRSVLSYEINGKTIYRWDDCNFIGWIFETSTTCGHRRDFTYEAIDKSWAITIRVVNVRMYVQHGWRDRQTIMEVAFRGSDEQFAIDTTLALLAI